jgi:ligand-binding SRPBCC domain-containing protein
MGKVYQIQKKQFIPAQRSEVWDFFSRPQNLAAITPPEMKFRVLNATPSNHIYPGQIIEYKVCPLGGLSIYWMTEITQVKEGRLFIDEQRVGPYRLWHHQHHFNAVEGGVEMTDIVHYQLPMGWLGNLAHGLFVKKRLEAIFDFRFQKAEEIFAGIPLKANFIS